jgi:hypothetical protein
MQRPISFSGSFAFSSNLNNANTTMQKYYKEEQVVHLKSRLALPDTDYYVTSGKKDKEVIRALHEQKLDFAYDKEPHSGLAASSKIKSFFSNLLKCFKPSPASETGSNAPSSQSSRA